MDLEEREEKLNSLGLGEDGEWKGLKLIVAGLPKVKQGRNESKCWTKEMEIVARDAKIMRRREDKNWTLVRKILRNNMTKKRYEGRKEE